LRVDDAWEVTAMNRVTGLAVVMVQALIAGPAIAQQPPQHGLGQVLDTLSGILGVAPRLAGRVVLIEGPTMIFRLDADRTVKVDLSGIDPSVRNGLQPGQHLIVIRQPSDRVSDVVRGAQIELGGAVPKHARGGFSRVSGTVQEVTKGEVLFKTREGLVLPIDTTGITGLPSLVSNQPATLIYEQGPRYEIDGVWIEPDTGTAQAPTTAAPPASPTIVPAGPPAQATGGAEEPHPPR
jgi:hypothetical protein